MHPLSREARLLLALARHRVGEEHLTHARALIDQGIDWDRLHGLAVRNNVVPLLSRSLDSSAVAGVPVEVAAQLRSARELIRMRAMFLLSWQLSLIDKVLVPRGVRFALIKGISLSQRCYGDLFARHSQDIDLLIEAGRLAEVASTLVESGWTVTNPSWNGHSLPVFARYSSVIELESPEGARIELHKTLDNSGLVFDSESLLRRTVALPMLARELPVLSPVDDFLYVCFHHSRHAWSCLHWCADLPAMLAMPGFASDILKPALADSTLSSTIAASLLLADNLDQLGAGELQEDLKNPSPFLQICLRSIDLDSAPEPVLAGPDHATLEPDFRQRWQQSLNYRLRFALSRCRPNLNDYDAWPLTEAHHWLYWLTRPWRAMARRMLPQRR